MPIIKQSNIQKKYNNTPINTVETLPLNNFTQLVVEPTVEDKTAEVNVTPDLPLSPEFDEDIAEEIEEEIPTKSASTRKLTNTKPELVKTPQLQRILLFKESKLTRITKR